MSRKEKLLRRLLKKPKDFTWDELTTVLNLFDFTAQTGGKTGGSRRRFVNPEGLMISLHKPHPGKILKAYQIRQIIEFLKKEGYVE